MLAGKNEHDGTILQGVSSGNAVFARKDREAGSDAVSSTVQGTAGVPWSGTTETRRGKEESVANGYAYLPGKE